MQQVRSDLLVQGPHKESYVTRITSQFQECVYGTEVNYAIRKELK
jgi:hypothetical protein